MKKLIGFFILALTTLNFSVYAQYCLPGETYITSQSEIDNFQINYPDCTKIEGKLYILNDGISNLDGLSVLTYINHLELTNLLVSDLSGIDNITDLGYLSILRCNNLTDFNGLSSLQTVNGSFMISHNEGLSNFEGLSSLTSVGFMFHIENNNISDFTGLNNLTTVSILSVYNNQYLSRLDGLESLSTVTQSLGLQSNPLLTDLTALYNLSSTPGITISNNDILTSLEGLNNIDPEILSYIGISTNPTLSDCAIQNICDYLSIPWADSDILNNAEGCNNKPEVLAACDSTPQPCLENGIVFSTQNEIDNFKSNYPNCIEIDGDVRITGDDIVNLLGLDSIIFIRGKLEIANNPSISSLEGLNSLARIGMDLEIWGNDSLVNLIGLDNLESIGNNTKISGNDNLINLSGLENLKTTDGEIEIAYNNNITNLNPLSNLNAIWGEMVLTGNAKLVDIDGLTNIFSGSIKGLSISDNPNLSNCNIESVCNFLFSPNGSIYISNNNENCNSRDEVYNVCTEWIEDLTFDRYFNVYPNPAKNELNIQNKWELDIQDVTIYNRVGQKVLIKNHDLDIIDLNTISNGIYVLQVNLNNYSYRTKIVVNK